MKKKSMMLLLIFAMILIASSSFIYGAERETGLYKDDGMWVYYENGQRSNATGLVQKPGANTWHYVIDGKYARKTGLVQCVQPGKSYGKWYYVFKGDLDKNATGLVKCIQPGTSAGKWYFVEKGKKSKKQGLVKCIQPGAPNEGKFLYIENGKYKKVSTVAKCIQPGDSGEGKHYLVINGDLNRDRKNQSFELNGDYYYAGSRGVMRTGWITYKKQTRYYDPETTKAVKDQVVDKLYVNANGLVTNASRQASAILDKIGWDLKNAYAYCRDKYYERVYGSIYTQGSSALAEYLFTKDKGNCYRKSAGFFYLAKTLGYSNMVHVQGTVSVGGISYVHGWCEMEEDGVKYIFDPTRNDAAHSGSTSLWSSYYVKYGSAGTFKCNPGYKPIPA